MISFFSYFLIHIFAQVDEGIVVPGAKIAGFHSLHYNSVMSSFILLNLLPNSVMCCSYIKCALPPVEVAVVCRSFFFRVVFFFLEYYLV